MKDEAAYNKALNQFTAEYDFLIYLLENYHSKNQYNVMRNIFLLILAFTFFFTVDFIFLFKESDYLHWYYISVVASFIATMHANNERNRKIKYINHYLYMIYESAFKNKTSEPVIRNNSRFDKFVSDSQYTFLIEQLSTLIWRKGLIDYPHFLKIEEFKEHANKHLKENEKKEATNNFLYALHIIFILIIVSIFPLLKYLK